MSFFSWNRYNLENLSFLTRKCLVKMMRPIYTLSKSKVKDKRRNSNCCNKHIVLHVGGLWCTIPFGREALKISGLHFTIPCELQCLSHNADMYFIYLVLHRSLIALFVEFWSKSKNFSLHNFLILKKIILFFPQRLRPLRLHTISERPNGAQSNLSVVQMTRLIGELKLRLEDLEQEVDQLQRQMTNNQTSQRHNR